MARFHLAALLLLHAAQVASANFFYNTFKSMACKTVPVPFICTGEKDKQKDHSSSSGGSSSSGSSTCPNSNCHSMMPGMGCSQSRGKTRCVGGGMMSMGTCQCVQGSCSSSGVCGGGQSFSDLTRLFEADAAPDVEPEDHSRVAALYTGAVCLMAVAGLSVGVRHVRNRAASGSLGDVDQTEWDLLEQDSSGTDLS